MANQACIMVVATSPITRSRLGEVLTAGGYRVLSDDKPERAREQLATSAVALVVLALDTLSKEWLTLAREISGARALILLLESSGVISRLLESGVCADDHVFPPFNSDEVRARCDVTLHRHRCSEAATSRRDILTFAGWELDVDATRLLDPMGREIYLTPAEFRLLTALARWPDRVQSRDQLLDAVAGRDASPFDRTIDVLVGRLRQKVESQPKDPHIILTVPRVGYKLAPKAEPHSLASAPRLPSPPTSIVVLPFANLTGDPGHEHIADWITDSLTTHLSRMGGSFVTCRDSAFTYKSKAVDVRQIGREFAVHYAVLGSVRQFGAHLQINTRLVDTESRGHIWADYLDANVGGLNESRDPLARQIARTLNLKLIAAAADRAVHKSDANAADYLIRGWAAFECANTRESTDEGRFLLEQALRLDGQNVRALAGLGIALASAIVDGWSTDPAADQLNADAVLLRALKLAPDFAPAYCALGMLRRSQGGLDEAVKLLHTAATLDRYHPRPIFQLGLALMYNGEPEKALAKIRHAIRLGPHEANLPIHYWGLGACQLLLGRTDEAIACFQRARASNPALGVVHFWLAGAYGLNKKSLQGWEALNEAARLRAEYASVASYANTPWVMSPAFIPYRDRTLMRGLRQAGLPIS
jgi:DNA-binding response OmpR family regulator/TolB-like protein